MLSEACMPGCRLVADVAIPGTMAISVVETIIYGFSVACHELGTCYCPKLSRSSILPDDYLQS